jgi:transcriptional regulator with XRE-family HTH domain
MLQSDIRLDGRKIENARIAKLLSKEELARRAKVSPTTIRTLEKGEDTNPQLRTIRALADALGVDPFDLLER